MVNAYVELVPVSGLPNVLLIGGSRNDPEVSRGAWSEIPALISYQH